MKLGLRARGAIAFALLALLVSVALALTTYYVARSYLVDQRESLVVRQAGLNARAVNAALESAPGDASNVLGGLPSSSGSYGVARLNGEWVSGSVPADGHEIPADLVANAIDGRAVKQRISVDGVPTMVVGIPLTRANGAYFEVAPLNELQRTLSVLRWSLVGGAALTVVFGALVGLYASRRVLRPLREFSDAADAVRRGHLDTRIAVEQDPDLAGIGAAFNEMAAALEQRTERDARFASDVSHELRNPLTAMSAAVDVIERRVDGNTQPAVEVLRTKVDQFSQLLIDLLELSRLDSGPPELVLESVEVRDYFLALLRNLGVSEGILEIRSDVPDVMTLDKRRVERVLNNLVDNANSHGDGVSAVQLSRGADGALVLVVEDHGPGIPEHEASAVFDRFHRGARQPTGHQGSGLGLAIVAEQCRAHGGSIRLESRRTGGARFLATFADGARS